MNNLRPNRNLSRAVVFDGRLRVTQKIPEHVIDAGRYAKAWYFFVKLPIDVDVFSSDYLFPHLPRHLIEVYPLAQDFLSLIHFSNFIEAVGNRRGDSTQLVY